MLTKTEGIILQNTRYADRRSILKIFTRQFGILTFSAVKGKSPSAKVKAAAMLPLQYVELSFNFKQNQEVQQLSEATLLYVFDNISRDYNKLTAAQFINEVMVKCIKEQHPNEELFDFIISSYKWFNETEKNNNFHICFLIELSKYLGFEPHNNYSEQETYFDTREGKFSPVSLSFPLGFDKVQSQHFLKVFDVNLLTTSLTRGERNELLECLLAYYRMHVAGFNELRSYRVLREMFDHVQ